MDWEYVLNYHFTTGKFWKSGSRKFYAIKRSLTPAEKGKGRKRPQIVVESSTSESDDFQPTPHTTSLKKKKASSPAAATSEIKEELGAIRQDLRCLFEIDSRMKVPVALYRQLCGTFKCVVCHSAPIEPPVIFGRCCKAILGCQSCIDTWFQGEEGMTKQCPRCGSERALPETMHIHGLDDFLRAIKPLLMEPQITETE